MKTSKVLSVISVNWLIKYLHDTNAYKQFISDIIEKKVFLSQVLVWQQIPTTLWLQVDSSSSIEAT